MKLTGKLIKNTRTLKEAFVEKSYESGQFRDALEECLIIICKELDIQVPVWLKKNTFELVNFQRTFFSQDQFVEKVSFDKFEIGLDKG